jgi:hypothetical protein
MVQRTYNPKIKGLKPATGTRREKNGKKVWTRMTSSASTVIEQCTINPKIKGLNPSTGISGEIKWKKSWSLLASSGSTAIENWTHNPKIRGFNPSNGIRREVAIRSKMVKEQCCHQDRESRYV